MSHIATMSLEVHTTFCVQIGEKSRVACECAVSRGQSSFGRYEHFARWSGRYEHFARFWRRGTIDSMLLYAQACNATFSARLDTKIISIVWHTEKTILVNSWSCSSHYINCFKYIIARSNYQVWNGYKHSFRRAKKLIYDKSFK